MLFMVSTSTLAGFTPSLESTDTTMPSRSSNSEANTCTGSNSGLPCCEARSFACWIASCAFTVNLSQRIAMSFSPQKLKTQRAMFSLFFFETCHKAKTGDENHLPSFRCSLQILRQMLSLQRPVSSSSADANLDLLGLRFGPLGHRDAQDAFVIVGFGFFPVHRVGQPESALEGAILALNAMEVLFLLFFFKLPLTFDGQDVVLQADVEFVLV